jgi:murein L,D-transpeptidase YcbB/YkuD
MMIRKNATALTLLALAASLTLGAPSANAQGLFEGLFGGGVKRAQRNEFPAPPPAPSRKQKAAVRSAAVPVQKISAPSYYTYKTDALQRVDFTALTDRPQNAAFGPPMNGINFPDALAGLNGFELLAEKDLGKALTDYYAAEPGFIWVTDGVPNARAADAIEALAQAGSHGLNPADYSVSMPELAANDQGDTAKRNAAIRFEMILSAKILRYVRDIEGGRIDPNRISGYYDFPAKTIDFPSVLKAISGADDVAAFLDSRAPQNDAYKALHREFDALRKSAENDIIVDAKLLLKPGQTSAELPKLLQLISRDLDETERQEFGEILARFETSEIYADEIIPLIKAVQKKEGLKADGVIGPRTVSEVAGTSKADKLLKVSNAMEQLRWMPSDLGATHVFINQPAFTASYIEDGQEKLKTRTVIGKTSNQTSFFYDEIDRVEYNPYWGVPQSIIVNEMLPRLRSDPGYLDRSGYEVTDSKGKRIPSSAINWSQYGGRVPFNVRQAPSEANALGELKIMFPNKHAIYMHDTPQKALFDRDSRAFSHGCVRLQDPRGMAAAVLGSTVEHVAQKLKQGHSGEKVTRKIPVYIAYFTAWPNAQGQVEYFGDVYDRDTKLSEAIVRVEATRAPAEKVEQQVSLENGGRDRD